MGTHTLPPLSKIESNRMTLHILCCKMPWQWTKSLQTHYPISVLLRQLDSAQVHSTCQWLYDVVKGWWKEMRGIRISYHIWNFKKGSIAVLLSRLHQQIKQIIHQTFVFLVLQISSNNPPSFACSSSLLGALRSKCSHKQRPLCSKEMRLDSYVQMSTKRHLLMKQLQLNMHIQPCLAS